MKPQKPITDKMKERANAMYLLLKQGGFWTKNNLVSVWALRTNAQ